MKKRLRNSPVAEGVYARLRGFKAVYGRKTLGYYPTVRQAKKARALHVAGL